MILITLQWFTGTASAQSVKEFSVGITQAPTPRGIVLGPDGNLWFSEELGNRIGRITAAGVITEFSAGLSAGANPGGIVAGPDGNLWFVERVGNRVGKITTSGVITEFSTGISAGAFLTSIAAGSDGNLWFTENSGNRIGRITPAGVVTEFSAGISAGAGLNTIVAGPDGNLWFTENSNRIAKITTAGVVTEFSAGITAGSGPNGIAAGPDGNLWFAELAGNRIGRITTAGVVTEFSAGITAGAGPRNMGPGPDGNVWFTEPNGNRIGRITPTGVVTEFSAGITPSSQPWNVVTGPDGNLWFTEYTAGQIGQITTAGVVTAEFKSGITPGAGPTGVALGPDGNIWFSEDTGDRIGRITPAGVVAEFSTGITAGASPEFITAGPDGNLWFTEYDGNRIGRITPSGVVTEFSAGISPGAAPAGITAGPDGNLWFAEQSGNRIGRITTAGVVTEFSTGITAGASPGFITAGPDGNLWFSENTGDRIGRITTGGAVTEFGTGITAGASPEFITAGPDGKLWFTEYDGNRIGRITTSGVVTEFSAGITAGSEPNGIAAGPDGNLWFTEDNGNRIGRITTAGVITEYSAGITANASPAAIAAGSDGNLWFAESDINRIARITTTSDFVVKNNNDNGAGSLRDAIAQANVAAPPTMITFDPAVTGTILLTSGQINVNQAVTIAGPGSGVLTIDANANSRVFSIFQTDPACPALDGPDYLVSISGLRLTNAQRKTSNGAGAIFTEHSLSLDSVQIDNSIAGSGGALYFQTQYPSQSLTITNSQFLNNKAQPIGPSATNDQGGALAIFEKCTSYTSPVSVSISTSLFSGNQALPTTNVGLGGAIAIDSHADVTITDTRIVGNQVIAPNPPVAGLLYQGGGMTAVAKTLTITRSEISGNSATDTTASDVTRGGGVRLINYAADRQTLAELMAAKIINSTISGNNSSATSGGMLVFGNVSLELDNSTVSNNATTDSTRTGGVLMTTGATTPPTAGNATTPALTLVSSILADNSGASGDVSINTTTIPTFTINSNNSLIRTICPSCSITVSGTNNLPAGTDPLLAPLANNGGPTQTQALMTDSPAIDTGSNPLALTTDQRGTGFPRTVGTGTDMGAYEASVGATAPVLQSAVSRKVHGAAGTFNLPLNLVPSGINHNPTTEPRTGPAQTIVLTFDKPINAATVTITEGVATAAAPTFSGNDVIVNLTGVTNQQYVTVSLTNVASTDGGTGGSGSARIGFLLGDVNGNRVISVADLALVNAQLAQTVSATNYLKDVNVSGTLSVADKAITNANLTRSLPAP